MSGMRTDPYRDEQIVAKVLEIQKKEQWLCIGGPLHGQNVEGAGDGVDVISHGEFRYRKVMFYCANQKIFMMGRFMKLNGLSDSDATTLLMKVLFPNP